MGSITWKGEGNSDEPLKWGGQEFKPGEAVKVEDPVLLRKAQNNPMFDVSGFKDEGDKANVVGNYTDSLTGRDVTLIAKENRAAYAPAPVTPGPSGPVAGTSGSFAGPMHQSTVPAAPAGYVPEAEVARRVDAEVQKRGPGRPPGSTNKPK